MEGEQGRGRHRIDSPRKYLAIRAMVGFLAALLIVLQGERAALMASAGLVAWLTVTTLGGMLGRWSLRTQALGLFGDSIVTATVVRATGGAHSPSLLLLTLPVLAGGLILFWRSGLILGLLTALLYGLIAVEQAYQGHLSGQLWLLVTFHTLLFTCMGLAAGLLASRMAASLREAAQSRSELHAYRLSTDHIIATLGCGLIALNADGSVRSLNPEARRLLGIMGDLDDLAEDVRARNGALMALLNQGLAQGAGANDTELELWSAPDASLPGWVKVAPAIDPWGPSRGLVAILWDLTDRKRLEAVARQRERMALIGEMSAGLAHEIRNSLKPITGSIELLQSREDLPTMTAPLMELIIGEAAALEAFLSQFLELARDKSVKLEQIDLEDLIETEIRALKVTGPWARREVFLTGEVGVGMLGDRAWLRQVFRNVILNALEAAELGRVEVRVERSEREARPWIRVRITDEGPGLEGVDQREAFHPFRTTKPKGTGLGLPIAQRGVTAHGGRIAFDPEWPHGGCVIIELPSEAARARQAA